MKQQQQKWIGSLMLALSITIVPTFALAKDGCELYQYDGKLEQVTGDGHFEGPVVLSGINTDRQLNLIKSWHMLGFIEEHEDGTLVAVATGHFSSTEDSRLNITHRGKTRFVPTEETDIYVGSDYSEVIATQGRYRSGAFIVGLDAGVSASLATIQNPEERARLRWSGGMAQLCRN